MPELPEVETTMRGVRPFVEGRVVKQAVVRERRLRWPVPPDFNQKIEGLRIKSVSRRAKYILFETGHGFVMIHLGMSGRLRV
ncbi:MAG: DNA-formamidopyrimidine glycosylase, partial [Proteobacteria bacterium]|nr:DNA-formamidopyrimidine glycosylase [Pseudomonadota bacterium]